VHPTRESGYFRSVADSLRIRRAGRDIISGNEWIIRRDLHQINGRDVGAQAPIHRRDEFICQYRVPSVASVDVIEREEATPMLRGKLFAPDNDTFSREIIHE
jgi:hypothetical protein